MKRRRCFQSRYT